MTVVADTSPLNYLVLIGLADMLPRMFRRIIIPEAVHHELMDAGAPRTVRAWGLHPPPWLHVHPVAVRTSNLDLDPGETAAIWLAKSLRADHLLMDDRKAVEAARTRGMSVVGTLGLLVRGAQAGFVDSDALNRLQATNFRCSARLFQTTAERIRNAR